MPGSTPTRVPSVDAGKRPQQMRQRERAARSRRASSCDRLHGGPWTYNQPREHARRQRQLEHAREQEVRRRPRWRRQDGVARGMARVERARGEPEQHRGGDHEPAALERAADASDGAGRDQRDRPRRRRGAPRRAARRAHLAHGRAPRPTSRGRRARTADTAPARPRVRVVASRAELPQDVAHARLLRVDEAREGVARRGSGRASGSARAPRATPATDHRLDQRLEARPVGAVEPGRRHHRAPVLELDVDALLAQRRHVHAGQPLGARDGERAHRARLDLRRELREAVDARPRPGRRGSPTATRRRRRRRCS